MTTRVTEGTRRENSGCRPRFSRFSRLRRSRARALPSQNLNKKRDCSQTAIVESPWEEISVSFVWNLSTVRFRARELWSEWMSEFPIDFNIKLVHYASLAYQMIFNLCFSRVYYNKSGNFSMSRVKFNCSIGRRRLFQEIKRHASR